MPKTRSEIKTEDKKLSIKPLSGYLLIEPLEAETRTKSGLYLPSSAQEKPAGQGMVIAIGDDLVLESGRAISAPVEIGDKVIYKKWGGDEIKLNGVEYKLVKFDDLMAILK